MGSLATLFEQSFRLRPLATRPFQNQLEDLAPISSPSSLGIRQFYSLRLAEWKSAVMLEAAAGQV